MEISFFRYASTRCICCCCCRCLCYHLERENCSNRSIHGRLHLLVADLPEILMAPQNQTIKLGKSFVLECDADGNPLPSISWQFNGEPLLASSSSGDLLLENENTELVVSVAKEQHAGKYCSDPPPFGQHVYHPLSPFQCHLHLHFRFCVQVSIAARRATRMARLVPRQRLRWSARNRRRAWPLSPAIWWPLRAQLLSCPARRSSPKTDCRQVETFPALFGHLLTSRPLFFPSRFHGVATDASSIPTCNRLRNTK